MGYIRLKTYGSSNHCGVTYGTGSIGPIYGMRGKKCQISLKSGLFKEIIIYQLI